METSYQNVKDAKKKLCADIENVIKEFIKQNGNIELEGEFRTYYSAEFIEDKTINTYCNAKIKI